MRAYSLVRRGWLVDPQDHARLNRLGARRTTPARHTGTTISRPSRERKYVGLWPWGKKTNVRNPPPGDYQEERPIDEVAKGSAAPPRRITEDAVFVYSSRLTRRQPSGPSRGKKGRWLGLGWRGPHLPGPVKLQKWRNDAGVRAAWGWVRRLRGICTMHTRMRRTLAEERILSVVGAGCCATRLDGRQAKPSGVADTRERCRT